MFIHSFDLPIHSLIYSISKIVHRTLPGSCHVIGAEKTEKNVKHSASQKEVIRILAGAMH